MRVCDGCNDIFCPSHAANPRCRTRCKACSGKVTCALCEEQAVENTWFAATPRIWCECCLVQCNGRGCGQRVCAAHARSGRCLGCLEQDMGEFMLERAAESMTTYIALQ